MLALWPQTNQNAASAYPITRIEARAQWLSMQETVIPFMTQTMHAPLAELDVQLEQQTTLALTKQSVLHASQTAIRKSVPTAL